jgi:hypothetical protein
MDLTIIKIWKDVLNNILKQTYKNILSENQINERIKYITDNIKIIQPESLYKCILYNDKNFEISKIAIDYKIQFASNNYIDVILSGKSYEIDTLDKNKSCVLNDIEKTLIQINHYMLLKCLNKTLNSEETIKTTETIHDKKELFSKLFNYKIHDLRTDVFFIMDRYIKIHSQNYICYSAVYGIDLESGNKLNDDDIKYIKYSFPTLFDIFSILKSKYPNGIDSKFIIQ